MKEEIEQTLRPLIGEPLSDMWRIAGLQIFEIGVQHPEKNRKGQDITLADQRLHVACDWRITGPEGTIVSSEDFGPDQSRCDEKAYPFYEMLESNPPMVETIEVDERGALRLCLSGGYTLDIQPDSYDAARFDDEDYNDEQWRFLPKQEERRHLVITTQGIDR